MVNYLLNATVIVSVELAQGQRASGFKPLVSNAFRKESQADKDPKQKIKAVKMYSVQERYKPNYKPKG